MSDDVEEDEFSDLDADNELNQPLEQEASGDTRRRQLFNYILERFY